MNNTEKESYSYTTPKKLPSSTNRTPPTRIPDTPYTKTEKLNHPEQVKQRVDRDIPYIEKDTRVSSMSEYLIDKPPIRYHNIKHDPMTLYKFISLMDDIIELS